ENELVNRKKHPLLGLLPAPYSLLPAPCSLLPAPCSLLPAPCSLLPAPCSLLHEIIRRHLISITLIAIAGFTPLFSQDPYSTPTTLLNPVIKKFENVPLNEDIFDGLVDGKEEHIYVAGDFMRTGMVKLSRFDGECHADLPYQEVLKDDFNGTSLNTEFWKVGHDSEPPNDVAFVQEFPHWFDPSMVRVKNGSLHLLVGKTPEDQLVREVRLENGSIVTQSREYMVGMVNSRNLNPFLSGTNVESGCFLEGRFTIRAKLPKLKAAAAFWFYGWAGEVDQFELCGENSECEIFTTYHQWNLHPCDEGYTVYETLNGLNEEACEGEGMPHLVLSKVVAMPDSPYDNFHEYSLEWENDKITWYFDDEIVYEVYRYYQVEKTHLIGSMYRYDREPIRCAQIPQGQSLSNIYEALWWDRLRGFNLNAILNSAINGEIENSKELDGIKSFEIDWFKVEQRYDEIFELKGTSNICLGVTETFNLTGNEMEGLALNWIVSENLEIVATNTTSISVKSLEQGPGFVRLEILNPKSCLPTMLKKIIYVGPPPPFYPLISHDPCSDYRIRLVNTSPEVGEISWQINMPFLYQYEFSEDKMEVRLPYGNLFLPEIDFNYDPVSFTVTQTNECGSVSRQGQLLFEQNCFKGYKLAAWPNPTSGQIQFGILKDEEAYTPDESLLVEVLDINMTVV
ncbi:MAG: family 16 glycosylhydrolase, partial [Saprospiraceae bacterium]